MTIRCPGQPGKKPTVENDDKKKPSRLTKALLETADDRRRVGVLNAASHEKITLRHLSSKAGTIGKPISGDEIRSLRERAHLSQAVFARYLNLTKVIFRNWNAEPNSRSVRRSCYSMSFVARASRPSRETNSWQQHRAR